VFVIAQFTSAPSPLDEHVNRAGTLRVCTLSLVHPRARRGGSSRSNARSPACESIHHRHDDAVIEAHTNMHASMHAFAHGAARCVALLGASPRYRVLPPISARSRAPSSGAISVVDHSISKHPRAHARSISSGPKRLIRSERRRFRAHCVARNRQYYSNRRVAPLPSPPPSPLPVAVGIVISSSRARFMVSADPPRRW